MPTGSESASARRADAVTSDGPRRQQSRPDTGQVSLQEPARHRSQRHHPIHAAFTQVDPKQALREIDVGRQGGGRGVLRVRVPAMRRKANLSRVFAPAAGARDQYLVTQGAEVIGI